MTEKRFKRISVCGDWGVKDTEKDKVLFFGTTDEVIDTVELLNNLVDENEQLKQAIAETEKMVQYTYSELTKLRCFKKNILRIKHSWDYLMEAIQYD